MEIVLSFMMLLVVLEPMMSVVVWSIQVLNPPLSVIAGYYEKADEIPYPGVVK